MSAQFTPTATEPCGINSACFGGAACADLDNGGKKNRFCNLQ